MAHEIFTTTKGPAVTVLRRKSKGGRNTYGENISIPKLGVDGESYDYGETIVYGKHLTSNDEHEN